MKALEKEQWSPLFKAVSAALSFRGGAGASLLWAEPVQDVVPLPTPLYLRVILSGSYSLSGH